MEMFEGFADTYVDTSEARIRVRHGGSGPPLLLLHGNPETHVCWHKVANQLATRYHVIATDLRGYGDSSAPAPDATCSNYSFRAMGQDQFEVMQALGYDKFYLAGHDRGGRTAHRMVLDHPEMVLKCAILDILPSRHVWHNASQSWAMKSWHWVFMAQTGGLPEAMMAAVPREQFLEKMMSRPGPELTIFAPEAWAEYVRCFTPKMIMGSCADYRACATVDLEMDDADFGRKTNVPLLILWGAESHTQTVFDDVFDVWRDYATQVEGGPIISGHFIPEQAPQDTLDRFFSFFV
jgi:haloacetate dehalogenase